MGLSSINLTLILYINFRNVIFKYTNLNKTIDKKTIYLKIEICQIENKYNLIIYNGKG